MFSFILAATILLAVGVLFWCVRAWLCLRV
jgi:hypothetical protein